MDTTETGFLVVGGGSAGAALAALLAERLLRDPAVAASYSEAFLLPAGRGCVGDAGHPEREHLSADIDACRTRGGAHLRRADGCRLRRSAMKRPNRMR